MQCQETNFFCGCPWTHLLRLCRPPWFEVISTLVGDFARCINIMFILKFALFSFWVILENILLVWWSVHAAGTVVFTSCDPEQVHLSGEWPGEKATMPPCIISTEYCTWGFRTYMPLSAVPSNVAWHCQESVPGECCLCKARPQAQRGFAACS